MKVEICSSLSSKYLNDWCSRLGELFMQSSKKTAATMRCAPLMIILMFLIMMMMVMVIFTKNRFWFDWQVCQAQLSISPALLDKTLRPLAHTPQVSLSPRWTRWTWSMAEHSKKEKIMIWLITDHQKRKNINNMIDNRAPTSSSWGRRRQKSWFSRCWSLLNHLKKTE